MQPDVLPDPDDLWWSGVALAALSRAARDDRCRFDVRRRMLRLDLGDGSWLRMQRVLGSRITLWGCPRHAFRAGRDPRELAPDWAVTEASMERQPSFLAWHAHDEWDTSTPEADDGATRLLHPLLSVDPQAVAAVREGHTDPDTLSAWTEGTDLLAAAELVLLATVAGSAVSGGAVRARLLDQIHNQMRDVAELDRRLMQRPPALVRWSRVNGPGVSFEYAVRAARDRLVPAPTNTLITEHAARTLTNVLSTLHREQATEQSGTWLFARVTSDGVAVRFHCAFDSWPEWYDAGPASQEPDRQPDRGPALEDLAWEMDQRLPIWRPAWDSLLPTAEAL